jgi:CheY-like chemotaxis protein
MVELPRPRVLVVEDSESYQELYTEILSDDFDVTIVGSKEEALALADQLFDVAVIDMRLKEVRDNVEGLDVAEHLRWVASSTRVILKSGYPLQTAEIAERIKQLNPDGVLDKSADNQAKTLRDAIWKALQNTEPNDLSAKNLGGNP